MLRAQLSLLRGVCQIPASVAYEKVRKGVALERLARVCTPQRGGVLESMRKLSYVSVFRTTTWISAFQNAR